jgi:quercetin dioxygenase-like cupin family protein
MYVVTADTRRSTTTPNATMTTLASPTLGGATSSLWLVEMNPYAEGPEHAFEDEVIWAVVRGSAELTCAGERAELRAGDTAVLPGGAMRRLVAGPDGFSAVATSPAPGTVTRADGLPAGTPAWVA